MSSPDSCPPPPYSAVNTSDQMSASSPYNPGFGGPPGYISGPPAASGYAPVAPMDPAYCSSSPYPGQPGTGMQMGTVVPPGQHTVIVNQPYVTPVVMMTFGESPVQTICPYCQAQVVTSVEFESGLLTWLICIMLAVFGCWMFCCLIPFCVDACKDVVHDCPNCRRRLSVFRRIR